MTQPSSAPSIDEQLQNGAALEPTTIDLELSAESDPLEAFRVSAPQPPQKRLSWRRRSMMAAFAASAFPVLIAGTAVFGLGSRLLPKLDAAQRETFATQTLLAQTLTQQRVGLAGLSVGTGVLAIVAGAAASALTWKQLEPVARAAKTTRSMAKRLKLEGDAERDGNEAKQLQTDADFIANRLPELMWQQETRAEQSAAVAAIEHRLRHATSTDDILSITVKTVRNLLEADRVSIFCFDETGEGTFVAESVGAGFPKALRATVSDPCFNEGYSERYRRGRILAIHNIYNAGLTDCHIGLLERFAVKANLVGPLMQGDRLYGLLIVHQCDHPRHWDSAEIDLMGQICARVGLALSFAHHLNAATRIAERKTCLVELPLQLHGLRDEREIFDRAARTLHDALEVESVIAIAFEETGGSRVTSVVGEPIESNDANIQLSETELETLQSGQTLTRSR
ncbi:MAG: GAF domain-containing protein, partial [Cyanobacteria bacterium J06648_11]